MHYIWSTVNINDTESLFYHSVIDIIHCLAKNCIAAVAFKSDN